MSQLDKETLRRIPLEAFSEGKVEVVDEVLAADFIEHGTLPPGILQARRRPPLWDGRAAERIVAAIADWARQLDPS